MTKNEELPVVTEALEPCPNPWCEAVEREGDFRPQIHYSNFALVYVACTSCGMAGPTRQHEAEAITAWNTRHRTRHEEALKEALRDIRACRSEGGTVQSVHGPVEVGPSWSISGLCKLLPRIDSLLADKEQG